MRNRLCLWVAWLLLSGLARGQDYLTSHLWSMRFHRVPVSALAAGLDGQPALLNSMSLRARQMQALACMLRAEAELREAPTAAGRARAAAAALEEMGNLPEGLPTGDLSDLPRVDFLTYLHFCEVVYGQVEVDPTLADSAYRVYERLRRGDAPLDPEHALVALQTWHLLDGPEVKRRIASEFGLLSTQVPLGATLESAEFLEAERGFWGPYLESRLGYRLFLSHSEAHRRSLQRAVLTLLAQLDLGLLGERPAPSQAGRRLAQEVLAGGCDLDASLRLAEQANQAESYGPLLAGYLEGLRQAPGPELARPGYRLQLPAGWTAWPGPAELVLSDPEGEQRLVVWTYRGAPAREVAEALDQRLKGDPQLRVQPLGAARGWRWQVEQSDAGSVWQVSCDPLQGVPGGLILIAIGPNPQMALQLLEKVR